VSLIVREGAPHCPAACGAGISATMGSIAAAHRALRAVGGLLAGFVILVAGSATAAEHGISGEKLLFKASKFALLSRDANAHASGSPVCPAPDSSLTFADGVHTHTFVLPCANWSDHGPMIRYKNASATGGPSLVKVARGGTGRLRVTGWGLGGFPIPNGTATIDVVLDLGGTIDRYCMAFSGVGDGYRFLVRDAGAGICPVCGNNTVEAGETCDGTADADCHGECQSDCSCPAPICGNNVREGSEACDGADATACPGACLSDCTCAAPCPSMPGDATACEAFGTVPQCSACCADDEECLICAHAFAVGCGDPLSNDHCTLAVTTVGCGTACCAPQ
jgi:hypothetical protein